MPRDSTAGKRSQQERVKSQDTGSLLTSKMSLLSSKKQVFARDWEEQENFRKREMKFWKDLNAQKKQSTLVLPAQSHHTQHVALQPVGVSKCVIIGQK